jgi:hypothetical protein
MCRNRSAAPRDLGAVLAALREICRAIAHGTAGITAR